MPTNLCAATCKATRNVSRNGQCDIPRNISQDADCIETSTLAEFLDGLLDVPADAVGALGGFHRESAVLGHADLPVSQDELQLRSADFDAEKSLHSTCPTPSSIKYPYRQAPGELILDFDATDDRVHGQQEGRFFHGC